MSWVLGSRGRKHWSAAALETSRYSLTSPAPLCETIGVFFYFFSLFQFQHWKAHYITPIIFPSPASHCLTDIAGETQIQTRQR